MGNAMNRREELTRPEISFRPLEGWPRDFTPRSARKRSPFVKNGIDVYVCGLSRELALLGARTAVVQTAHRERDISRTTGRPFHDVDPSHPGVIVAADTKIGALKWVCDDCTTWQDNVRAISLTLERLRLCDKYGVTRRGEQYTGWKMLPGPITASSHQPPPMTIDAAAHFLAKIGNTSAASMMHDKTLYLRAYRYAAKELHPDAGGNDGQWEQLQQAKTLLDSLNNRK